MWPRLAHSILMRVPEELHDQMHRSDLIYTLQHLDFVKGKSLVTLDRHVRDYLVHALRRR